MAPPAPSYDGRGLVNLVAEMERRLTGSAPLPGTGARARRLDLRGRHLRGRALRRRRHPPARHPAAGPFRDSLEGTLDAPFATTTTVSLASVATGLAPAAHGVLGHLLWLPGAGKVVNTLKWVTPWGEQVDYDTGGLLPSPNLWERLRSAGREPITVQPADFLDTPLTRALYRGCRFEPGWSDDEIVTATVELAAEPGRLILTYLPPVDFAAHVWGQGSPRYAEALASVARAWERLVARLPDHAVAVGTSDHGHVDYAEDDKILVRDHRFDSLRLAGDPRTVMAWGEPGLIEDMAGLTGAELLGPERFRPLYGPGPDHPELDARLPTAVLLAPPGKLVLPRGFDKRLVGYHGGLDPAEVEIPLLVGR
jgi:hypothetical protein